MKESDKTNLILFLVIGIIIYLFLLRNNVIDGFSGGIDTQALSSIASIYNKQNLTVDNLTVTGWIDVNGGIAMNDKEIRLRSKADGNHLIKWTPHVNGPLIHGYSGVHLKSRNGEKDIIFDNSNVNFNKLLKSSNNKLVIDGSNGNARFDGNLVVKNNIYPNDSRDNGSRYVKFRDTLRIKGGGMNNFDATVKSSWDDRKGNNHWRVGLKRGNDTSTSSLYKLSSA